MNNIYHGDEHGLVTVNGKLLKRFGEVLNHSPDGFNWGYGGSGAAQLALAIMCNEFGASPLDHPAHYQEFKWRVIAQLETGKAWTLSSYTIQTAIKEILEGKQRNKKEAVTL